MAGGIADQSRHLGPPAGGASGGVQAGDVEGTGIAIGHGAQAIVNNIHQYIQERLPAEQMEAQARLDQSRLGQAIQEKLEDYRRLQYIAVPADFNPYRSLLNYRVEDAAYYWREQAIADLQRHMLRGALTVLHSVSGAGKSSLLQAGLASRLLENSHLPIYLDQYGNQPVALAIKKKLLDGIDTNKDYRRLKEKSLRGFLLDVYHQLPPDKGLYIFLDQFETFFERSFEEQRAFGQELSACLNETGLRIYWVVSLRTPKVPYLDHLLDRAQRHLLDNRCPLLPFDENEARTVIVEPARVQNASYEAGLVDQILADARDADGRWQPPEVQLVCHTLFEEARQKHPRSVISRALYKRPRGGGKSGVEGILRDHLQQVVGDLPTPQQQLAWHLLYTLVTPRRRSEEIPDDEPDIARRSRRAADMKAEVALELRAVDDALMQDVLERLENRRLLRVDRDKSDSSRSQYELAHDYLLREIDLPERMAARKLAQDAFDQSMAAFGQRQKLLDDDDLKLLDKWWGQLIIKELDRPIAEELREKSRRASQRRMFWRVGVAVIAASLVIAAAILATGLVGAREAEDNALATVEAARATSTAIAQAQSLAEEQAAAALAQAEQAENRAQAANDALRDAFEKSGVVPVGGAPAALAFYESTLWVVAETGNTIEAFDPLTGLLRYTVAGAGGPVAILSAAGRLWVADGQANVVQIINPRSGTVEQTIPVSRAPFALAYAGDRVWVASKYDGSIQAIDPTTGVAAAPVATGNKITALFGDGQVLWIGASNIVHGGAIKRLDPAEGSIEIGPWGLPEPLAFAYDGANVWVLGCCLEGSPLVARLDRATLALAGRPVTLSLQAPGALLADGNLLWVTDRENDEVLAIDPRMGQASQPFPVGPRPTTLAFDGADLWVINRGNDTVQRIILHEPPVFGPVTGTEATAAAVAGLPTCVAGGHVAVATGVETEGATVSAASIRAFGSWACDGQRLWHATDDSLEVVDAQSGLVLDELPMDEEFAGSVAFDGAHLWVTAYVYHEIIAGNMGPVVGYLGALQQIDPESGELLDVIKYDGQTIPVGLVYDGRWLWLASRGDGASGQLLRVHPTSGAVMDTLPLSIDPVAMIYDGRGLWLAESQGETVQYVIPSN